MKIEKTKPWDVTSVALNMRERDFHEFSALHGITDRNLLAKLLCQKYGNDENVLCAYGANREPIAIGGLIALRPGVRGLLFFATDEFPSIGVALTRFIHDRLFPAMDKAGVHRIEAVSLDGYEDVHRWIVALGLQRETPEPMQQFGANGEAFVLFARVRDASPSRH